MVRSQYKNRFRKRNEAQETSCTLPKINKKSMTWVRMCTMNVCEDREYLNHKDIEEKIFTRVERV
jgi:hypothetical protein